MGNKRVPGFIILFLTFLTQPVSLYPQGSCCDLPGWDYYSLITIDNTCCAVTYTNRGYLIEVNTQALISAGKMNASGSDIRFKDGFCNPNLLDYCFESGVNTPNTLIWVKLPSLPANGVTQIYMFFGNTSAFPAQNCASIFQNVLTVTSSTSMSGVQTYDEIDIQGGAVITVSSGSILELNALKITMAGTITGNNAGYGPQSGPGSGVNGGGGVGGSGGSYGGSGGSGGGGFPAPYGTTSGTDIDMGSGGGGSDCSPSAAGGGAVKLVADFISVTGTITMNGQNAANCCCGNTSEAAGGGAGGGILIQCDYASGNGQLIARGGRGGDSDTKEGGGGGGGGRIKICYSKTNNFSGTTDVAGGQPGVGPQSGETAGQNGTSSFFICTEAAITVNPDQPVKIVPVPGFTFSNICANGTASFTNTSTITPPGQIVANNWDFGDAGTSTLQSPTHIYTSPGTFNVTLTVTSDSGCIAAYNTAITVGPYPVAGFTTSNVCGYDTVQFNNITTISGGTVTYLWNFGDASTSTLQNPSHFYTAPNTYSVTLTATSDNGCVNTATQPVTVYPVPAASFTITNSGYICLDQAGTFTNTSTILSGTVTYGWDFGDGGTSFLTSPSHIYANPGTYLVTLAALSNYNCLDTVMRNIVVSPEPVAGFTIADVCLNNPSIFSDVSTISGGTISTWQWNFGDGIGNSVLQNPVYQYASPGNFNVQLVVTSNNNCQDTAIKAVNIFPLPNADFTFTNACFGQPNTFTDASSIQNDNIVTWIWDFGDASSAATANTFHTYSAVNSYNVELLVTSSNGCKDSISYTVTVSPNPVPDFTPVNVCETSPAVFTSASTVSSGSIAGCVWDFGDFDTSMSCNTTHLYAGDGTYLVTLLAMTDKNCFDTVKKNIIIYPAPTADFTFVPACEGFITVFTDISTVNNDIITGWQWDFGDASPFDNTQSPQHTYASDGIYQVELITFSGSGCSDTIKKSVESYIVPVAFFSATSVCEQEITQFTDMSSQTDTLISWTWDFGDGTPPVYLQNPSYTYSIYGFYACTLNIQTDEGCLASYSGNVTVYALPVIQITSNLARGCEPLDVQFTDISTVPDQAATGNAVQSYIWNFGDGASSTLSNPPHTYVNDGTYDVDLEITTSMGCNLLVTFNNYIIADPLPVADFDWNPDRSTILGPKKYFTDLSDLAAVWWWDFGDGSVDSAAINPVHAYDDTGSYTVKLEVLTVYGCYDDTIKTVYIEPDFALFIPNAFSPNGDGKNEIFRTPLIYPLKYDMYIFDRWGNEIYHTTDWQTGWDGRANNGPREAMQDVYVYLVTVTDAMQKKHRYVGHVTLVK